jgi:hypothetical protein
MSESFLCPYPLAYGFDTDATTVWVLEQANCALRCPTVTYTEKEWEDVGSQAEILFTISLVGTCVIFFYQIYHSKMKAEFLPRIMFLLGFFLVSLILVIFLFTNGTDKHNLTCDGDSGFVETEPLCVVQAASTIFFIIWIEMWSFFMAYENYLFICSALEQSSNHGKNNKTYLVVSFFVCSVCTAIPLFAGNLGFDYQANLPICLFMVSENRNYLWGAMVAPFGFFAMLCLVYTLLSIRKIQSIFVHSENYLARNSALSDGAPTEDSLRSSQMKMGSVGAGTVSTPMHDGDRDGKNVYGDDRTDSREHYDRDDMHNEPVYDYNESTSRVKPSFWKTTWDHIKRTWKYNGRQMVFFGTFCVLTLAILPVIIYSYGTQFDYFVEGTEHFIECLLEAAARLQATDPSATQESVDAYAESECGAVPSVRPSTVLVCLW